MKQLKADWMELWWNMGNGIQSEIEAIKATDIFEFWTLYDLWIDRLKKKNASRTAKHQ